MSSVKSALTIPATRSRPTDVQSGIAGPEMLTALQLPSTASSGRSATSDSVGFSYFFFGGWSSALIGLPSWSATRCMIRSRAVAAARRAGRLAAVVHDRRATRAAADAGAARRAGARPARRAGARGGRRPRRTRSRRARAACGRRRARAGARPRRSTRPASRRRRARARTSPRTSSRAGGSGSPCTSCGAWPASSRVLARNWFQPSAKLPLRRSYESLLREHADVHLALGIDRERGERRRRSGRACRGPAASRRRRAGRPGDR